MVFRNTMRAPNLNRDSTYLFFGNVAVALLGLITGLLVINNLDIISYGKWVILLDATLTLGSFVDFGMPNTIVRYWDGKSNSLTCLIESCQKIQRNILFLIMVIPSFMMVFIFNNYASYLIPWIFLLFGSSMNYLLGSYRIGLRLMGEAREESLSLLLDRIFMIICLLGAIYVGPSLINLSIAYFISMNMSFFYVRWRFFSQQIPHEPSSNIAEISTRSIIYDAFPFALTLLVIPMIGRIDKFILVYFEGYEAVSIFNVAWLVIMTGLLVPISVRQSAIAVFGGVKSSKININRIIYDSRGIVSTLLIIGIPSCIIISQVAFTYLFPEDMVNSKKFEYSGITLVIFLLPSWIWAMLGCVELESLKMHNSSWKFSAPLLFSLLINTLASFLLIPRYDLLGATISTGLTFFITFLISSYISESYKLYFSLFIRKLIFGILFSIILYFMGGDINIKTYEELFIMYTPLFLITYILILPDILYIFKKNIT